MRSMFCFMFSVSEIFPPVSLNFAGGASMVLKPEEYLVHLGFAVSYSTFLKFIESCRVLSNCFFLLLMGCFLALGWSCNVVHWFSESSGRGNNFRRLVPEPSEKQAALAALLFYIASVAVITCEHAAYEDFISGFHETFSILENIQGRECI